MSGFLLQEEQTFNQLCCTRLCKKRVMVSDWFHIFIVFASSGSNGWEKHQFTVFLFHISQSLKYFQKIYFNQFPHICFRRRLMTFFYVIAIYFCVRNIRAALPLVENAFHIHKGLDPPYTGCDREMKMNSPQVQRLWCLVTWTVIVCITNKS